MAGAAPQSWKGVPLLRLLRKTVLPYLQGTQLDRLAAGFDEAAAAVVDQVPRRPGFDVVADVALPLAGSTMALLLGAPPARGLAAARATLARASRQSPAADRAVLVQVSRILTHARTAGHATVTREAIAQHEACALTGPQALSTITGLLFGAVDSLTAVFPTTILPAMQRPQVRAALRAEDTDPSGRVVEELLRLAPPFPQDVFHFAREPVDLPGRRVGVRETVIPSLLHANLDPLHWPHPLTVRHAPAPAGYLSGHGAHFCPGAAAPARLQVRSGQLPRPACRATARAARRRAR